MQASELLVDIDGLDAADLRTYGTLCDTSIHGRLRWADVRVHLLAEGGDEVPGVLRRAVVEPEDVPLALRCGHHLLIVGVVVGAPALVATLVQRGGPGGVRAHPLTDPALRPARGVHPVEQGRVVSGADALRVAHEDVRRPVRPTQIP